MRIRLLVLVLACLLAGSALGQNCTADIQRLLPGGNYTKGYLLTDASGHGDYGYFHTFGGYYDPGKWTVCESLFHATTDASQYCYLHLAHDSKTLSVGACVPASCSSDDLEALLPSDLVRALHLPNDFAAGFTADCRAADTTLPWGSWVLLAVIGLLAVLIIIGTLLDAQITYGIFPSGPNDSADEGVLGEAKETKKEPKLEDKHPNLVVKLLLCFSFVYNYKRLTAPSPPGSFNALNGVRVIAMAFVVMGHTFYFLWDTMAIMNFQTVANTVQNFRFQIVVAGFYAVDTFFFLSGFLVAYLFVRELQGKGLSAKMMGMFYFHRIYRLTPSLVMGLFFFYLITPYWDNGPYWMFYQKFVSTHCDNGSWVWTILYVQNLISPKNLCMGWSWYLADDMQYYALSPLVLIAYWKNKYVGWALSVLGVAICMATNLGICISNDLQEFAGIEFGAELGMYIPPGGQYGKLIYLPPWTRVSPYLIGFCCAFIMLERGPNFRISRFARGVVYVASTLIIVILSFISWSDANYGWTDWMNYVWITISRPIWSVGLGSLLVVCVVGYGGVFSAFMSQGFWVPLARLSYGAYIFHLSNISTVYNGYKSGLTYSFSVAFYFFLGHLIIAFLFAFANYFLVEKPLMNIESILLRRKPRAKTG